MSGQACTIEAWLRDAGQRLKREEIDNPNMDARLLLAHVTGMTSAKIIAEGERHLTAGQFDLLEQCLQRRLACEPVSRIVGTREFYGRSYRITPATLDPRPDSETLIDVALEQIRAEGWQDKKLSIIDVGTGSGCLLLTLLAELPKATGLATDISQDALDVARENAATLGLLDRVRFLKTDLLDGVNETFDLLVTNPPYIPSKDIDLLSREVFEYDPRLALDGGEDGLQAYRTLADGIYRVIPDGWAIFEVGFDQAQSVVGLLHCSNLAGKPEKCLISRDLGGHERVVAMRSRCGGK